MPNSVEDLMRAPTREQLDARAVITSYQNGNEIQDPKYTLNPLHPIRFCRTIRDGILYLNYVLHGGPL